MNPELLLNRCLREHTHGRVLAEIMAASLAAVEPGAAVERALRRADEAILVNGRRCDLRPDNRVYVVGGGKAGAPMAIAAHQVLGERISAGLVIVKEGHLGSSGGKAGAIEITKPATRCRTRAAWRPPCAWRRCCNKRGRPTWCSRCSRAAGPRC
ncbi:MAG: DUF4147 domain-containing protein [Pyrinomonadaceae bacterium]